MLLLEINATEIATNVKIAFNAIAPVTISIATFYVGLKLVRRLMNDSVYDPDHDAHVRSKEIWDMYASDDDGDTDPGDNSAHVSDWLWDNYETDDEL